MDILQYRNGQWVDTIPMKKKDGDSEWSPVFPIAVEFFTELFLDNLKIESLSGVSKGVNRPIKNVNNPITPLGLLTDADIQYGFTFMSFLKNLENSGYTGFYSAKDALNIIRGAQLISDNSNDWIKPNLGLINYEGNTNNNLFNENIWCISVKPFLNRTEDQRYIAAMYNSTIAGGMVELYKSPDKGNWTLLKSIFTGTSAPEGTLEIKDFIQRYDGKWIAYCVTGHNTRRRKIVALISDTDDPSGTWSWASGFTNGIILSCTSYLDQKYHMNVEKVGDIYIHRVSLYQSDNTITGGKEGGFFPYIQLYASRDGLTLIPLDMNWISCGNPDEWDDKLIYPTNDFFKFDNEWRIYYTGSGEDHNNVIWKTHFLGYASIGFKRIGQVSSNGTLITTELDNTKYMNINCDASSGNIKVELLSSVDNSILTGYEKENCDIITTNSYDKVVTWRGGRRSFPAGSFKIKFYIENSILYSYSLMNY